MNSKSVPAIGFIVLLGLGLVAPRSGAQEAASGTLAIEEVQAVKIEDLPAVLVRGRADLPDGVVLQLALRQWTRVGMWVNAQVEGGRYEATLGPIRARVIPGA